MRGRAGNRRDQLRDEHLADGDQGEVTRRQASEQQLRDAQQAALAHEVGPHAECHQHGQPGRHRPDSAGLEEAVHDRAPLQAERAQPARLPPLEASSMAIATSIPNTIAPLLGLRSVKVLGLNAAPLAATCFP